MYTNSSGHNTCTHLLPNGKAINTCVMKYSWSSSFFLNLPECNLPLTLIASPRWPLFSCSTYTVVNITRIGQQVHLFRVIQRVFMGLILLNFLNDWQGVNIFIRKPPPNSETDSFQSDSINVKFTLASIPDECMAPSSTPE